MPGVKGAVLSGILAFFSECATNGRDGAQVLEERIPALLGEREQDLPLQFEGNVPQLAVDASAGGFEANATGATVALVRVAFDPAMGFHPFDQRGHGVGIAAHQLGQLALGEAGAIALGEVAHDDELIGGDTEMRDAAAEGLIQAVPGMAQHDGEAPLGPGRVGMGYWVWAGFGHKRWSDGG